MSKKKNILIMSPYVPYDSVGHAGGKTHNFFIKALQSSGYFNVTVISFGSKNEKSKLTLEKYGIMSFIQISAFPGNIIRRIADLILSKSPFSTGRFLPFPFFKQHMIKTSQMLKKGGYTPDIIYLEWTMVGLLIHDLKNIFPDSIYGIMEVDLVYQAMERLWNYSKGIERAILKSQAKNAKKTEFAALEKADFIVVQNCKDHQMLSDIGFDKNKIKEIVPFYESKSAVNLDYNNRDLIFYGAMGRPENYLSAIWLIDNIFNPIRDKYKDVNLYIVGGGPPEELVKMADDRIIVTGFVDNPNEYFQKGICLVAPLQLGAGIKVKIIEAMSAGMPVITNGIGIEGIPAEDGVHYLHAEKGEEYIKHLDVILSSSLKSEEIGKASKKLIEERFNFEKSAIKFSKDLASLLD